MTEFIAHMMNRRATLGVHLAGGAITDFRLRDQGINPLSFSFTVSQMPAVNQAGAPFRGHFLCAGHWGPPSPEEEAAGIPYHSEAANQRWELLKATDRRLDMEFSGRLQPFSVQRTLLLDPDSPVFLCLETLCNTGHSAAPYTIVQHPTIAAPFLTTTTRVWCNAGDGFHYEQYGLSDLPVSSFPIGLQLSGQASDLSFSTPGESGVHCFIVRPGAKLGWVVAYSPEQQLLFGYAWLRRDYPWINLWRQYGPDGILYRGLEFGTTGVHAPNGELPAGELLGESVQQLLTAGESVHKRYLSFLLPADQPIQAITGLRLRHDGIVLRQEAGRPDLFLRATVSSLLPDPHAATTL